MAFAAAAVTCAKYGAFPAFASPPRPPAGLADLARAAGKKFGCAVMPDALRDNPRYAQAVRENCTILVAETHMKWLRMNPEPGIYTFEKADRIVDFAQAGNMAMRFHTLVWHNMLPAWVDRALTGRAEAEKILRAYAGKVLPRYRGKMHSWDIVNEAIEVGDGNPGGLRATPWYRALGPDYVADCFRIAREYDPGGDLVLSDYGFETADRASAKKRRSFLALVRDLKDRGVPLDAVGLQSHLKTHMPLAGEDEYMKWLEDLKQTGVKIFISELDADDRALKGDAVTRARANAGYVRTYLGRIFAVTDPEEIVMWGIWDGNSFVNADRTPGGKRGSPTLYAENWDKNPLYDVMAGFLAR